MSDLLVVAVLSLIVLCMWCGRLAPRRLLGSEVERLREEWRANHFAAALSDKAGCSHDSVPWPVMTSDEMLVAWLCEECLEQRDTFTPPAKITQPVGVDRRRDCKHEYVDEFATMDGAVVQRWCADCFQSIKLTREIAEQPLDITGFTRIGEDKPCLEYKRRNVHPKWERPPPWTVTDW